MAADLPLFVALDVEDLKTAETLIDRFEGRLKGLKVGPRLFALGGRSFLSRLVQRGFDVFLDMKFHDIPNTVALAVDALADLGLFCMTLHGGGGTEMLQRAVAARDRAGSQTKLIGITVLTSFSEEGWKAVNPGTSLEAALLARARVCRDAGLDGLVCSPLDLDLLSEVTAPGFIKITPGVRFAAGGDDQTRVATPREALKKGADYLVMGRPIYQAPNLDEVLNELDRQVKEGRS